MQLITTRTVEFFFKMKQEGCEFARNPIKLRRFVVY